MSSKIAGRLIASHQVRLAGAIARQVQQVVPRYRRLDRVALERTISTLLAAVVPMLVDNDDRMWMSRNSDIVLLRTMSGFSLSDILVANVCVLPVARRFFNEKAASAEEASAAYEAIELHVLRTIGRLTTIYEATRAASPPDADLSAELALQQLFEVTDTLAQVHVEPVTGDDAYEHTDPDNVRVPFRPR